jgi:hypothetical protein
MSSARTRLASIEERTLRIGFGIKRPSESEVRPPQLLALLEALLRGEGVPIGPFRTGYILGAHHGETLAQRWISRQIVTGCGS